MSELHESASTGDLEALEDGLRRGLDPSEPDPEWGGRTPLHIASSCGHKKCVYVLLKAGSDVNARTDTGWTPAHSACETGQVREPLETKPDVMQLLPVTSYSMNSAILTRLCFYTSLEVQQRTCLFSPNISTTLRWSSSVVILRLVKKTILC